jgi:hypothetical protein
MGGSPSGRGARWPALAFAGVLAVACSTSPVTREAERWHVRTGAASVADLAALEPGWERSESPGALLAFRRADGARAAWLHQCRAAAAEAKPEAHALLIRLEAARVEREGPLRLAGCDAWGLVASAFEGERLVTLAAVTRVAPDGCTDDFVLVTQDLAAHGAGFERWWASFTAGPCP